jgi:hypothetical protein
VGKKEKKKRKEIFFSMRFFSDMIFFDEIFFVRGSGIFFAEKRPSGIFRGKNIKVGFSHV